MLVWLSTAFFGVGAAIGSAAILRPYRWIRPEPEERYRLILAPETVTVLFDRRPAAELRWNEIMSVEAVTTDQGPWQPDMFLRLRATDGRDLVYPAGAQDFNVLFNVVSKAPGFDFEAWMLAAGSTSNAVFPCWEGSGMAPPDPTEWPAPANG